MLIREASADEFGMVMGRLWAVFGHGGALDPILAVEWAEEFASMKIEDFEATYLEARGRRSPRGFPRPSDFREWYGELAIAGKLPSQRDPRESAGELTEGRETPPEEAIKRLQEIKSALVSKVEP